MKPLSIDLSMHGETLTLTRVCRKSGGDHLVVECRVGRIPSGREAFWQERLLALNFQICASQRSGFSLCPHTSEVTCSATYPLETTDPEAVYGSAVRLATSVRHWRRFLSEAGA